MSIDKSMGNQKLPSIIKDPFEKNSIEGVSVRLFKGWNGEWRASGNVNFKNGNTEGTQNFKAQTFDEVVVQIKSLLQELNCTQQTPNEP